eukprot:COSAG04_NODE_3006_length_3285_cov_1.590709_2_plen_64_part_00
MSTCGKALTDVDDCREEIAAQMDEADEDYVWVEFHSSLEAFESRRFRVEWTAAPLPDGRPQRL